MGSTSNKNFTSRLPTELRNSLKPRTIEIWSFIHNYVKKNKYTDTLDEKFTVELRKRFGITKRTASKHLLQMYRSKLLSRWVGPGQIRHALVIFMGSAPTRIVRYTLPSVKPPKQMYREKM